MNKLPQANFFATTHFIAHKKQCFSEFNTPKIPCIFQVKLNILNSKFYTRNFLEKNFEFKLEILNSKFFEIQNFEFKLEKNQVGKSQNFKFKLEIFEIPKFRV